ncbi:MAG: hypothetical protein R3C01_11490 [Planctomycetaceae bacterium]
MILLATQDLMFSSRVSFAAETRSRTIRISAELPALMETLSRETCELLLIDLESPGIALSKLLAAIPSREQTFVIAYGPHVQTARLDAAQQAGCDLVLSRGQFDRELDQILAKH